jgi:predicted ester cyclase
MTADITRHAREAIEIACSGDLSRIEDYYSERFVDHVNETTLYGHDGARESVSFYTKLFADLRFEIEEQLTEGDRVASRYTLHGNYHGRPVALRGITISRFEDGKIIEDWSYTNTLNLLRQIGILRTLRLAIELATGRLKPPTGGPSRTARP